MADCYGCPYRWHDEDCEYCGARGDEIIDGKSYKKESCPYYVEYKTGSSSGSSSSYSSSSASNINPKKGGKCWSCKYCDDIGTPDGDGEYYRKCTKSGHEYLDTCKFYCSDYVWDGKYAENSPSGSSTTSSSGAGCGIAIIVIIVLAIVAGSIFVFPKVFSGYSEKKEVTVSQQITAVVCNVNYALNMRDAASSDGNVITTVPKGETVVVLEQGEEYCLVEYGEYQGYCATECLEIQ